MKVATGLGRRVTDWQELSTFAREAERLGVDSLWAAESWVHDGATPLAYLMATTTTLRFGTSVMQVGTRTPALVAMTALTLHSMSGGRYLLGLGASGPRVMEGWHGVPFRRPIQRTRETVEICRRVFAGEPLEYQGSVYRIPLDADHGGTGDGAVMRGDALPAPDLPIYLAALAPKSLRMAGELADGWIAASFVPETAEAFLGPLREGALAAGRSLDDIDIGAGGQVRLTDDVDAVVEELRLATAFLLGGMGSQQNNYYFTALSRQGWGEVATQVQKLWREGRPDEAGDLVPDDLVRSMHLVGTRDMVRERLRSFRDAGVDTFRANLPGNTLDERLAALAELMELVGEVNADPRPTGG